MRKLIIALLFLSLVAMLSAQENPHWTFKALTYTHAGLLYGDYGLSVWAINNNKLRIREGNPFMKYIVEHYEVGIAYNIAIDLTLRWAFNGVYRHNKPVAYGLVIVFIIIRSYIIYDNVRMIQKCGGF